MAVTTTTETNTVNPVGAPEITPRRPAAAMADDLAAATRRVRSSKKHNEVKAPHEPSRD
jgi:hypothetical protein